MGNKGGIVYDDNDHDPGPSEMPAAKLQQIHDAMMEELGIGRKNDLPLADQAKGRRGGGQNPPSKPATTIAPPVQPSNPWQTAKFDDIKDAEGLQSIADGQLYRIRKAESKNADLSSQLSGQSGGLGRGKTNQHKYPPRGLSALASKDIGPHSMRGSSIAKGRGPSPSKSSYSIRGAGASGRGNNVHTRGGMNINGSRDQGSSMLDRPSSATESNFSDSSLGGSKPASSNKIKESKPNAPTPTINARQSRQPSMLQRQGLVDPSTFLAHFGMTPRLTTAKEEHDVSSKIVINPTSSEQTIGAEIKTTKQTSHADFASPKSHLETVEGSSSSRRVTPEEGSLSREPVQTGLIPKATSASTSYIDVSDDHGAKAISNSDTVFHEYKESSLEKSTDAAQHTELRVKYSIDTLHEEQNVSISHGYSPRTTGTVRLTRSNDPHNFIIEIESSGVSVTKIVLEDLYSLEAIGPVILVNPGAYILRFNSSVIAGKFVETFVTVMSSTSSQPELSQEPAKNDQSTQSVSPLISFNDDTSDSQPLVQFSAGTMDLLSLLDQDIDGTMEAINNKYDGSLIDHVTEIMASTNSLDCTHEHEKQKSGLQGGLSASETVENAVDEFFQASKVFQKLPDDTAAQYIRIISNKFIATAKDQSTTSDTQGTLCDSESFTSVATIGSPQAGNEKGTFKPDEPMQTSRDSDAASHIKYSRENLLGLRKWALTITKRVDQFPLRMRKDARSDVNVDERAALPECRSPTRICSDLKGKDASEDNIMFTSPHKLQQGYMLRAAGLISAKGLTDSIWASKADGAQHSRKESAGSNTSFSKRLPENSIDLSQISGSANITIKTKKEDQLQRLELKKEESDLAMKSKSPQKGQHDDRGAIGKTRQSGGKDGELLSAKPKVSKGLSESTRATSENVVSNLGTSSSNPDRPKTCCSIPSVLKEVKSQGQSPEKSIMAPKNMATAPDTVEESKKVKPKFKGLADSMWASAPMSPNKYKENRRMH